MRNPLPPLFVALLTFLAALLGAATPAIAAPPLADDDAADASVADPTVGLPWQAGPKAVVLGRGIHLAVPANRRFLAQPEAGRLMAKFGNLHNDNLLGVVLPVASDEDWLVSIRYDAEGYVKDDEKLDAKELLESFRSDEPAYNEERKKLGFPPIHADGWMEEPRYEKSSHHVLWALIVSSEHGSSVNLNTRILGRKGFVSVNLVTGKDELVKYRAVGGEILRATSFENGERYEDFNASTDKVAEYGLTGLILGGAGLGVAKAAKVGLLAGFWKGFVAILVAAKKGVVFLIAGAAAFLKKIFGVKREPEDASP